MVLRCYYYSQIAAPILKLRLELHRFRYNLDDEKKYKHKNCWLRIAYSSVFTMAKRTRNQVKTIPRTPLLEGRHLNAFVGSAISFDHSRLRGPISDINILLKVEYRSLSFSNNSIICVLKKYIIYPTTDCERCYSWDGLGWLVNSSRFATINYYFIKLDCCCSLAVSFTAHINYTASDSVACLIILLSKHFKK